MPQDPPMNPILELLHRIPLSARVVLDVGCGTGDLLGSFRSMAPTARLLGMEADPDAAAIAAHRLDHVAVCGPETDPLPFDLSDGVDCIIYGTALQTVAEPFELLRRHARLLTPDGMLLICVPNIEHWSFVSRLLEGSWDYESAGLLDRRHLRWFSLDGMRRGLVAIGLDPCDAHARVFDGDRAQQFATALAPALETLGIDAEAYRRRAAPLQYVWRVRREPRQRLIVAGNMMAPVGGVSHVRVLHPLNALTTDPGVIVQLTDRLDMDLPREGIARIFVLHRPALSGEHGREVLRHLWDQGWLVVTEYDDHPDFFRAMQDEEQLTFRGVHAVQTSTPALAEVLRRRNPEIAVFPNALMRLPEVNNFTDPGRMTMFFGALNREQDWRPLMGAINEAIPRLGDRLAFQVIHDGSFFEALRTPHKTFTPICDYDTYLRILGQCEISFMPLEDNGFNRAKSDLKFIEAAGCRVAPLAGTVVYGDSIQDGRTGVLFRNAEELLDRLLRLVSMPALAREIGDGARRYVAEERMLAQQVAQRISWYRSLWARRDALTAAVHDRLSRPYDPRY